MPGKRILVVDDDPALVKILALRFLAEGFDVCTAANGEEAVAKAKSEKPHLIIMDVMMPKTSGYEAMLNLRNNPEMRGIPAIILSARPGMKDFFAEMNNIEFIPKPFDFQLLSNRVAALLENTWGKAGRPRHAVIAGVEDLVVNRIRDLLIRHNFKVLVVLNEKEAVALSKKFQPDMVFCQFWEDGKVLDPRKISQELLLHPAISKTPFYVYCKEALSLEAMKDFKPDQIVTFKEISDLLRKVEDLVKK